MNRILLFLALLACTLCACHDGSSSADAETRGCTTETCYVLVVYPNSGVGDQGFLDIIYYGISRAKDSLNFSLENVYPKSAAAAETFIERFFEESYSSTYRQRLLIVTAGTYDSLFTVHKEWKQDPFNKILVFEPRNDSYDAHFWDISMYGASYIAGRATIEMDYDSARIIAANKETFSVTSAIDGFVDGYQKGNGNIDRDSIYYIDSKNNSGFSSQKAYDYGVKVYQENSADFLFPVMGGSAASLFRFMRENSDLISFISCGMDVDQQYLSDRIAYSIAKHMDYLALKFLNQWAMGDSLESDFIALYGSGFIDIKVASGYEDWSGIFEMFDDEAIDADKAYWEER